MTGANADRQQRLAAALRENLKRRKTAAKARDIPPDDASDAKKPQADAGNEPPADSDTDG